MPHKSNFSVVLVPKVRKSNGPRAMLNKMPANGATYHKERDAPGREAWALSGKSPSINADADRRCQRFH